MRTVHDSWCPADCRYHLNSRGRAEFEVRLRRTLNGQAIGRTVRIMADSREDATRKVLARLGRDYTAEAVAPAFPTSAMRRWPVRAGLKP